MKIKKMMALVTAAAMAFGLAGCGGGNTAATTAAPAEKAEEKTTAAEAVTEATEAAKSEGSDNWKVAILTGTVSQGEEEFRAAEKALATYGPEHIVTATDPDVKAIVMCQAVPGAKAGFDKVREMGRDDILLIAGTPQEDPAVIAAASDLVLYADEAAQGDTIMEKCADWGIDVFVHYSFPRHMAMELIVARHELLKKNADALGIEMVDVTAPDPTAEAGLSASQQFILEDVPQQLKKYEGKKVAFFTTNCGMQPSLQTACLDEPSPYHAFPATLGLELAIGGDDEDALKQIAAKLKEHDAVGRFSTWASPVAMTIIAVGVDYAKGYITGEITDRNDADKLVEMFNSKVEGAKINNYTNAEGETFDNYYTILLAPVDFNDYL